MKRFRGSAVMAACLIAWSSLMFPALSMSSESKETQTFLSVSSIERAYNMKFASRPAAADAALRPSEGRSIADPLGEPPSVTAAAYGQPTESGLAEFGLTLYNEPHEILYEETRQTCSYSSYYGYCWLYFKPETSGYYRFFAVPVTSSNSMASIDLYHDSDYDYRRGLNMSYGPMYEYYLWDTSQHHGIHLVPYRSDGFIAVRTYMFLVEPNPQALSLMQGVDLYMDEGMSLLYSFTPTMTGEYNIVAGPYRGTGSAPPASVTVYKDAYLWEEHTSASLTAGHKYYLHIYPNYGHEATVWARLQVNPSPQLDQIPPTAPGNLIVTGTTANSATLSWNASTDNFGVAGYDIYNGTTWIGSTVSTSFTVTGLAVNTTHPLTVKAKDYAGRVSAASNTAHVYIDTLPPTAPTQLTVSNETSTHLTLSWNASTDNVGIAEYHIFNGTNHIGTSPTTSITLPRIANTTYLFTVKAKDAAGNFSAASAVRTHSTGAINSQYTYDRSSRLKEVVLSNGKKKVYTFDANGNVRSVVIVNP